MSVQVQVPVPTKVPVPVQVPMQVPTKVPVPEANQWPTLSATFSELMNDKGGLRSIQHKLSERTLASKLGKAEADAQKIRGPVTLVLAGLRGASRILSIPLNILEGSPTYDSLPGLSMMSKFVHTLVLLILSAVVYVVYTTVIFTRVTDENTFMIVSTLAWMLCLVVIMWMAT